MDLRLRFPAGCARRSGRAWQYMALFVRRRRERWRCVRPRLCGRGARAGVAVAHCRTGARAQHSFAVLPEVFGVMPGGRWFAVAFFLLLIIAALTSTVALLEVPVAWAVARWRWRRERAAAAIGMFALALGGPVALGYGVLAPEHPGSPALLDRIDHVSSNILFPLSGIAVALFIGWAWHSADARVAADLHTVRAGAVWHWSMRI